VTANIAIAANIAEEIANVIRRQTGFSVFLDEGAA
jgi:hypothetical protein